MKELIFTLTTSAGTFVLDNSPDGWDDNLIQWERSDKYWGVFRSFTIALKFIKDGATKLRTEFCTYGTSGTASIVIERLNKVTQTYSVAYSGVCDLGTYRDTDDYVEVNLTDSGIAKAIKDNGSTEYVLTTADSVKLWEHQFRYILDPGPDIAQYVYYVELVDMFSMLIDKITGGKITDGTYLYKSDYLETYRSSITQSGGSYQTRGIVVTTGLNLRMPTVNVGTSTIKTTFEDLFNAVTVFANIGVGIEIEPASGKERIRVENKTFFFDTAATTISLGSSKSISVGIDSKIAINRLKIGFPAAEYDSISSLGEPNATSFWKTLNNTSKLELNLISKYRADSLGIHEIVVNWFDSADDVPFFCELSAEDPSFPGYSIMVRDTVVDAIPDSTGIVVGNGGLTPRQCLLNNLSYISSLIWKFDGTNLAFTSGNNALPNIKVLKYGGASVFENANVVLLAPQYFIPLILEIECPLPSTLIDDLNTNSTRQATFEYLGVIYSGWIMEVRVKLAGRGSGKIKLLSSTTNDITQLIR